MNSRLVVDVTVLAVVVIAAAFLVNLQQGATTSTGTQTTTSISTEVGGPQNLRLELSVNASSAGGSGGNETVSILVDAYNTLASANNVSTASHWALDRLSLGSCGYGVYPFGVAMYLGVYTAGNVSGGQPLRIYPFVPCPLFIRLVTGYLFQPTSDLAVLLPGGTNASATPVAANLTATAEYSVGAAPSSAPSPIGPGTYTVVAGDEWGSLVFVHFTVGAGGE